MEHARVFKFEDEDGNHAFVAAYEAELAKGRLKEFTLKTVKLVRTEFMDDLPGYASRLSIIKVHIIKNDIPPF